MEWSLETRVAVTIQLVQHANAKRLGWVENMVNAGIERLVGYISIERIYSEI